MKSIIHYFIFTWKNIRLILNRSFSWVSCIYAFLGFVGTFVSLELLNPCSAGGTIGAKLTWSIIFLLLIAAAVILVVSLVQFNRDSILLFKTKNGKKIYLEYGDILNIRNDEQINVLLSVNRCFDAIVDNVLISDKSVHGKFIKDYCKRNEFTEDDLNGLIIRNIKTYEWGSPKLINKSKKPQGNCQRYPLASVSILKDDNVNYLLFGLTAFDEYLTTHVTKEEYLVALQRMITVLNRESQGYPIYLPLLGDGLSRLDFSTEDIIRTIINTLNTNKDDLTGDIHIVVYDKQRKDINILDFE